MARTSGNRRRSVTRIVWEAVVAGWCFIEIGGWIAVSTGWGQERLYWPLYTVAGLCILLLCIVADSYRLSLPNSMEESTIAEPHEPVSREGA